MPDTARLFLFCGNCETGSPCRKTLEEAVDGAISKSLNEGVLKDLLKKNRAEVRNVVLTEYNEELHLKNVRECGYEEGYDNGYDSGLDQGRKLKEIYKAVVKAAPEYDLEKIKEELKINNG